MLDTKLLAFGLYLAGVVAIGLVAAARNRATQEDYFLGGRRTSAFATALSAVSSGRSAWLIVGVSGLTWSQGVSTLWFFPGYILAEALMFVTLGPRLRRASAESGAITLPEVLERVSLGPDGRPGSSRLPLRPVAAVISMAFLTTYVGSQLAGGGKTLGAIFEVQGETTGLVITALIVGIYTLLGGYRAVVATDVVQALLMLFGLLLLPLLGLIELGGVGELLERLRAIDPTLLELGGEGFLGILGGLAIGLGSPGNPHILVRHMALGDPKAARTAMWIGTFWNVVMAGGALAMGLVARALYPLEESLAGGREGLFAALSQDLSAQFLFAGFAGFLVAALFAAVMSTCDSQLLVVASSLVRDFRGKRKEGEAPESDESPRSVLLSRLAVLGSLGLALALNYGESALVNDLVLKSWAALGAAFGPTLLVLLYDRRTSARGVTAGMLGGLATLFLCEHFTTASIYLSLIPAWVVGLVVTRSLRAPGDAR